MAVTCSPERDEWLVQALEEARESMQKMPATALWEDASSEPVLLGRAAVNRFRRSKVDTSEEQPCTGSTKHGRNKIRFAQSSSPGDSAEEMEYDSEATGHPGEQNGVEAGRAILSMLRTQAPARVGPSHSDPQPLSTDEFQLWAMQAREDAEIGADVSNEETFGKDASKGGWSFEENLAANQQILHREAHLWEANVQSNCARWAACRYNFALKEMVQHVRLEPECLKKALIYVVEKGWDVITWKGGYTALHLAAEFGATEAMPLLVALGADIDALDSKGRSPRQIAKVKREFEAAKVLKSLRRYQEQLGFHHGIEVDSYARDGTASQSSAEPEPEQDPGKMPPASKPMPVEENVKAMRLYSALQDMVELLQLPPVCFNAVMYAATTGDQVIAGYGWFSSVLHVAVKCGRDDILPMLVKLGADLHVKDSLGMTPVELALSWQSWSCLWMLQKLELSEQVGGTNSSDSVSQKAMDKDGENVPGSTPPGSWAQLRPRMNTKKAADNFVD
jgi:hypothetical protein